MFPGIYIDPGWLHWGIGARPRDRGHHRQRRRLPGHLLPEHRVLWLRTPASRGVEQLKFIEPLAPDSQRPPAPSCAFGHAPAALAATTEDAAAPVGLYRRPGPQEHRPRGPSPGPDHWRHGVPDQGSTAARSSTSQSVTRATGPLSSRAASSSASRSGVPGGLQRHRQHVAPARMPPHTGSASTGIRAPAPPNMLAPGWASATSPSTSASSSTPRRRSLQSNTVHRAVYSDGYAPRCSHDSRALSSTPARSSISRRLSTPREHRAPGLRPERLRTLVFPAALETSCFGQGRRDPRHRRQEHHPHLHGPLHDFTASQNAVQSRRGAEAPRGTRQRPGRGKKASALATRSNTPRGPKVIQTGCGRLNLATAPSGVPSDARDHHGACDAGLSGNTPEWTADAPR